MPPKTLQAGRYRTQPSLYFFGLDLYRENAVAIESEARDPFGGNVYYVTQPQFARKERTLHCDIVHVTTKWVSRLVLDHAIAAIPFADVGLHTMERIQSYRALKCIYNDVKDVLSVRLT